MNPKVNETVRFKFELSFFGATVQHFRHYAKKTFFKIKKNKNDHYEVDRGANENRSYQGNECPGYDTKSDGEVPVMLKLWGMQSTPSLPLFPGRLWSEVGST